MTHLLTLATTLIGATTTKKTSSSSVTFLIFIVIVVGALYFLFLRPNQQRARKQREDNASINVGDRVVSIGGIVGRIEEIQNDRVVLLTGGNPSGDSDDQPTRLVMLRTAIARKVVDSTPAPGVGEDDEDEDEHHGTDDPSDTGKAEGEAGA